MAPGKRMRIFAGPNGSGKTTIFKKISEKEKIHLGVYVNADDIEQALSVRPELQFSKFKIETPTSAFFDEIICSIFCRRLVCPKVWV